MNVGCAARLPFRQEEMGAAVVMVGYDHAHRRQDRTARVTAASVPLLARRTLKGRADRRARGAIIAQAARSPGNRCCWSIRSRSTGSARSAISPRETVFESARVDGVPGDPPVLFCETEQDPSFTKAMVGSMGFGLVGLLRPTKLVTRYCLYDTDGRRDARPCDPDRRRGRFGPRTLSPSRPRITG